jgi:hypothetical protein
LILLRLQTGGRSGLLDRRVEDEYRERQRRRPEHRLGFSTVADLTGAAARWLPRAREGSGVRGGLADKARYRPFFYGVLAFGMLGGLTMNFVGIDPIKALFATAVINGLVAPPLLILITLLGSDRKVMGEHTSGPLSKTFGWLATAAMSIAAIALVLTTVRGGG